MRLDAERVLVRIRQQVVRHLVAISLTNRSELLPVYYLPEKKTGDGNEFKVGDPVTVSLSSGRVVDAVVMAVVNQTDGVASRSAKKKRRWFPSCDESEVPGHVFRYLFDIFHCRNNPAKNVGINPYKY